MYTVADYVNTIGYTDRNILLLEASALLDTLGMVNHAEAVDRTVTDMDELSNYDSMSLIENILLVELKEILKDNKVVLVKDSTDLTIHMELVRSLLDTDLLMYQEQIEALADDSPEASDFLCDVVSLITDRPAIEYMDTVEHVTYSFIDDVLELLETQAELEDTQDHDDDEYVCEVDPLKIINKFNPIKFKLMVDEGFGFGYALSVYLNELIDDAFDSKQLHIKSQYSNLVTELTVAVGVCKEGLDEGLMLLERHLEDQLEEELYILPQMLNDIKININGVKS